mgnify:CR=1 FL=1
MDVRMIDHPLNAVRKDLGDGRYSLDLQRAEAIFSGDIRRTKNILMQSRDEQYLAEWSDGLAIYASTFRSVKAQFASKGTDPSQATAFLGLESVAQSLSSLAKMLISLKQQRFHDAWVHLVDSEEWATLARKAGIRESETDWVLQRIRVHEEHTFPKMVFASAAFTAYGGVCTVCGQGFDECVHEEGLIYNGQMCALHMFTDLEFHHQAIVELPRDKRCYATAASHGEGIWVDWFTGVEQMQQEEEVEEVEQKNGVRVQMTIFRNQLPFGALL